MTDSSPFRIGLVGAGYWGKNYLRLLGNMEGVRLAFVVDKSPGTLSLIDTSVPTFATISEALTSKPADAAVIVTPPTTHTPLALECLNGGLDVLMEKPVALSSEEMDEVRRASERTGRIFFPGHIYTHNDWISTLAGIVRAPSFGSLFYATSTRMGTGASRVAVGVLWDLAPHDLSILDLLGFGPPEEAMCLTRSFLGHPAEDTVFALIRYPHGRTAQLHLSWHSTTKVRDLLIVGSRQCGRFVEDRMDRPLTLSESSPHDPPGPGGLGPLASVTPTDSAPSAIVREPLRNMVIAFVKACRAGAVPQPEVDRAIHVTRALEALERSAKTGAEWVQLGHSHA
ncbi:MAG: Gfo/Idh/MocA family oxidoreductase [Thermoplasmata archaeon]